jgi:hypothetical protein
LLTRIVPPGRSGDDMLGVHAWFDHLKCHLAPDRFGLLRHMKNTAASLADLLKGFIATDAVAGGHCLVFGKIGDDVEDVLTFHP